MEDIKEVFKVIAGNENYSISNFGNVMNNKNNKLLKLFNDIHGYRRAL
jgi:predicted transcriptional regulator